MEKNNRRKQGLERRETRRLNILHLSLPVEIKIDNTQQVLPGILLDISPYNVGLLTFKEMDPDTMLELSLSLHNIKTGLIKAKVVWVKEIQKTYRLGVKFIEISDEDKKQIYQFIDTHLKEDF
ncbi:MAG: PilZ domain-containing protein [Endomicrobiia bacterium]